MAIRGSRVAVEDEALLVATGPTHQAGASVKVFLRNSHATDSVFLGNADVTDLDGFELKAGETIKAVLGTRDDLYAIAVTASQVDLLLGAEFDYSTNVGPTGPEGPEGPPA